MTPADLEATVIVCAVMLLAGFVSGLIMGWLMLKLK